MAATPEAKVKKSVRLGLADLQARGAKLYYHMPVQNGMGRPTLDFIGCIDGKFFAIEAKAPGKLPTPQQQATIQEMTNAGAIVIVVSSSDMRDVMACLAMLSH